MSSRQGKIPNRQTHRCSTFATDDRNKPTTHRYKSIAYVDQGSESFESLIRHQL